MPIEGKRLLFWNYFLKEFGADIRERFLDGPSIFKDASEYVYQSVLNTLIENLEPILLPSLVAHIRENSIRGNLEENKAYNSLIDRDPRKTLQNLGSTHSSSLMMVYNRCRRFMVHFHLLCDRIFLDWPEIEKAFGISDKDSLFSLKLTCGDEHFHGTQTSLFLLNGNKRGFAYKPVNIISDNILQNLFKLIDSDFALQSASPLKIIAQKEDRYGSYGYIELCSGRAKVQTQEEVAELYKKFGRLLAFGKAFKIADGHCDNIIIHAPEVLWIDLETAFHQFSNELKNVHPLEKTGLIMQARPETVTLGIVTGIQGGVIPRLGLTQPSVYQDGCDSMYIRYFKLKHVAEKNRIYLNNSPCFPEDYMDAIKLGFKETFVKVLNNKEKIISFIDKQLQDKEMITRQLFLVTASYKRYISLTQHPVSFKKGNVLECIRSERKKNILEDIRPFEDFIIEKELVDIANGVVPYFYRKSNSRAIFHASGASRRDFFSKDLMQDISAHIDTLSDKEIEEHLNFIESALWSTANIRSWEDFMDRFKLPMFDFDTRRIAAEGV